MEINIKWTDKATDETAQRIYVSNRFGGEDARHYLVAEVAPDVTSAAVAIPTEFEKGPVFITVTAVRNGNESNKKAYYVTQDGRVSSSQFVLTMAELNRRYLEAAVPPQIDSVTRGAMAVLDQQFMSVDSVVGLLPDGRVLSVAKAGSPVTVYSPASLLRTVVNDPQAAKLASALGAFDQNGRYWVPTVENGKIVFYAFEGTEVFAPVTVGASDSVGTQVGITCDDRNHILLFNQLDETTVVVIDVDVSKNTYKRFDVPISGMLFSGGCFVLGSGRSVMWGKDAVDNTLTFAIYDSVASKFVVRRPRVAFETIVGVPCALGEAVLFVGERRLDESTLQPGLHLLDFADINAVIVTRVFVGLPITELSAPVVSPWGGWLVGVGAGVEGAKLLLVAPKDFEVPATEHRFIVPQGGTTTSGYNKLFRTGKYYFQYKADGSYVRYSFAPIVDVELDPKFLINNHQQGGSRLR